MHLPATEYQFCRHGWQYERSALGSTPAPHAVHSSPLPEFAVLPSHFRQTERSLQYVQRSVRRMAGYGKVVESLVDNFDARFEPGETDIEVTLTCSESCPLGTAHKRLPLMNTTSATTR